MEKSESEKRAVSPLIATVLLIGITLAVGGMIYAWASGFIAEHIMKFGESADVICQRISFDADFARADGFYELIINNRGNVPITNVNVLIEVNGETFVKSFPLTTPIAEGGVDSIGINFADFGISPGEISSLAVTPVITGLGEKSGRQKLHACEAKTKTGLRLA